MSVIELTLYEYFYAKLYYQYVFCRKMYSKTKKKKRKKTHQGIMQIGHKLISSIAKIAELISI